MGATPAVRPSYREYRTPADLRAVFACLWVKSSAGRQSQQWRTIPNGHSELVWDSVTRELVLAGPGQSFTLAGDSAAGFSVGLRIRPEHTAWFAGMPASEIVGRSAPMAAAQGARWQPADARMAEAGTPSEALAALLAVIRKEELLPEDPDPVVRGGLSQLRRAARVGEVGSRWHYSEREVRRRFRRDTGLAPKTMQKVIRFQRFLAIVSTRHDSAVPLGLLAAQCGYADQAHLTRECVTWSGLPPGKLVKELAASCWLHHDHAASWARPGSAQSSIARVD
jgi:AraC-like DNA-binding protein